VILRWLYRIATAFLVGVAAACAATVAVAAPPPSPSPAEGWTETRWGPLGPADRDLLAAVRRAGLWEIPASQAAQRKADSGAVRRVGAEIAAQHQALDSKVRAVAAKLDVPLPAQPNADQQGWLSELDRASGAEFDSIYVDRLRAAHGKVFSLIASVRAGTRNSLVREFAATVNDAVMTHMALLESTGLVDYARLPAPAVPGAARADQLAKAQDVLHRADRRHPDGPLVQPKSFDIGSASTPLAWLVVLAGFAAVLAAGVKALRPR
jgi:predicted outer membrane protein